MAKQLNDHINDLLKEINQRSARIWTDKINYLHILIIWVGAIVFFGLMYHFLQNDTSHLTYSATRNYVNTTTDAIYFSFVSATTTGFGDIVPSGYFKIIAIIEVVFGLMLLAVVTSKLVSIKQDVILNELYELSFKDRITRLRSSLMLFRQNIDRVISKVEEGSMLRREVTNIYTHLVSLHENLSEVSLFMNRQSGEFIKNVDTMNTEIIFNSILNSFDKFHELVTAMDDNRKEWRTDNNLKHLSDCVAFAEGLFKSLEKHKNIPAETIADLTNRKNEVFARLRNDAVKRPQ